MSDKCPNLRQFVKNTILPRELENNVAILDMYTQMLFNNVNNYDSNDDTDDAWFREVIADSSPCPGWMDTRWYMTLDQISDEVIGELKTALNNDNIEY